MIFLARAPSERDGPATRHEICNLLLRSPGLTKSQLCRKMNLAWGTISYHVRVLERQGETKRQRVNGWTRIYLTDTPSLEVLLMPLLRENAVPQMLQAIETHPGLGIQALSIQFGISRKVVRRQLNALVAAGALTKTNGYRPQFFPANGARLAPDPWEPLQLPPV